MINLFGIEYDDDKINECYKIVCSNVMLKVEMAGELTDIFVLYKLNKITKEKMKEMVNTCIILNYLSIKL